MVVNSQNLNEANLRMAYWKKSGKMSKVLVRKTVKKPLKRKVGFRNLTDKEAKRENKPKRKKLLDVKGK